MMLPPNSAVKLPAPLALLVGGRNYGNHLSVQPVQRQSAPQLTAGVAKGTAENANLVMRSVLQQVGRGLAVSAVGAGAFFAGLATCLAGIDPCTWFQRYSLLLYVAAIPVAMGISFSVCRKRTGDAPGAAGAAGRLGCLLLVPWFIGVGLVGPSLFGAAGRGHQKATMAAMQDIASRLAAYQKMHGAFPIAESVPQLRAILGDAVALPEKDAWDYPYRLSSRPDHYILSSSGKCGRVECSDLSRYAPAATSDSKADIVMQDGVFIRYPEGVQVRR